MKDLTIKLEDELAKATNLFLDEVEKARETLHEKITLAHTDFVTACAARQAQIQSGMATELMMFLGSPEPEPEETTQQTETTHQPTLPHVEDFPLSAPEARHE